jgi:hypothetical protein
MESQPKWSSVALLLAVLSQGLPGSYLEEAAAVRDQGWD